MAANVMTIDFSYDSYRALLGHIRSCGHTICPLRAVPASGHYVILRHDIDYSVAKALEMAEIEHDLGVQATVFLMLGSPYYNLLDSDNLAAARRIARLGHEIGFHYDTDLIDEQDDTRLGLVLGEHAVFLSRAIGTPVTSVAQHNPSVTRTRVRVPGFTDAYDDRYFKQIAYLSDSRRLFGSPDPYRFFEEHDRCQLLIHPLWWHRESRTRRETFAAVRAESLRRIDTRLAEIAHSMEGYEERMRGK
jgi:hypothetical protein